MIQSITGCASVSSGSQPTARPDVGSSVGPAELRPSLPPSLLVAWQWITCFHGDDKRTSWVPLPWRHSTETSCSGPDERPLYAGKPAGPMTTETHHQTGQDLSVTMATMADLYLQYLRWKETDKFKVECGVFFCPLM